LGFRFWIRVMGEVASKEEEARKILAELEEIGRRKYVTQVFVAAILASLGERIDRSPAWILLLRTGARGCCSVWWRTRGSTACAARLAFTISFIEPVSRILVVR
jgi:hypothetical protein